MLNVINGVEVTWAVPKLIGRPPRSLIVITEEKKGDGRSREKTGTEGSKISEC